MHEAPPGEARWPERIRRAQAELLAASSETERQELRGDLWRLLFEALSLKLRFLARGSTFMDRADLEDIAAEKALETLARAERGAWDLTGRSSAEISGYLGTVARNGRADAEKQRRRERATADPHAANPEVDEAAEATDLPVATQLLADFVTCVESLPARGRKVWFLRAHYGLSGREIAAHPEVGLKVGHVDVLVQRARVALKECLREKGHIVGRLPAEAFVALWELFERLASRETKPLAAREGNDDDD